MPFRTAESTPTALLGDELVRVLKLMHVARARAPRHHEQVDPMAYPLLFNLKRATMRVSELADAVHSDVSTVSRQVSTLVEHGLVVRQPDPADGRAHVLAVTDAGTDLLLALREGRDRWLQGLLSEWSDDDVRDLTAHLARLAADLETSLTDPTQRTDR
ncbi:MarR family winged helix-turn-helix transcriptional regulator [Phycicoccus sonneratiae]|uniref:MarR family transcriptional regulator n=1 Tax=Phycicoccus sonneratiae TaxID=2807628 RepID=A0ABS2CP23_9MICO|nr:MarR family transcriptional regulator [Phycicoccus sonneraticus]MBM6401631.1 MarR family transcriptional regulator [Phycicoccus sonneraticus]